LVFSATKESAGTTFTRFPRLSLPTRIIWTGS
jgi:hypothetical protein